MLRYESIVWDWNGTLLDDTAFCVRIMNKMLSHRHLPPISYDLYRALIEFPVIDYYKKLGFNFEMESFETISDEFVSLYQGGWRECTLQEGALETLTALRALGVKQSVLSASKSSHLLEQLEYFGVSPMFDVVTGADNHHGHGKLHIARDHVALLGTQPSRTLFIGDTAHDAEVSSEAGCECLLVSYGHYSIERLQHTALPFCNSMAGILGYIQR